MSGTVGYMPPRAPIPDGSAVPATVTLMRERRGLTKTQFAASLEHQAQWASKVESGAIALRGEALVHAGYTLDVPPEFLLESAPLAPSEGTHFRSYKITAREQAQGVAEANFTSHVLHTLLLPMGGAQQLTVPQLDANLYGTTSHDQGVGVARAIRGLWDLGRDPVNNLVGRMEACGLFVTPMPAHLDKVSGLTVHPTNGHPAVTLLTAQVADVTRRFTAAHELGHLVMDQSTDLADGIDIEKRAHAFASELLMPYDEVEAELRDITPSQLNTVYRLHNTWGIHPTAIIQAAYRHQSITDNQRRRWWQLLNGPEARAITMLPNPYPVTPKAARNLVRAYEERAWTTPALSAKARIFEKDLLRIIGDTPASLPVPPTPQRRLRAV